jgi:hypothetical protein
MTTTVTRFPIIPRPTAALSSICSGNELDKLLGRAVHAYAAAYGSQVAVAALQREIIKIQCVDSARTSLAGSERIWGSTKGVGTE